jgi:hypothetical protein
VRAYMRLALDLGVWHVMTGLPYMIRLVVPTLGLRKPKGPILGMDVAGCRGGRHTGDPGSGRVRTCLAGATAPMPSTQLLARTISRPNRPGSPSSRRGPLAISGLAALQARRDEGREAVSTGGRAGCQLTG